MNHVHIRSPDQPTIYTNARLKVYPKKAIKQVATQPIFVERPGVPRKRGYAVPPPGFAKDPDRALRESRRRARSAVRDIALCNQFDYFFTLTVDGALLDRYDPDTVGNKVRTFLSNSVRRKGFQYVLVPEYHKLKEGETTPAIHMHGLCNLGSVHIVRAVGKNNQPLYDKGGRPIYNMPSWKWGHSTCVPVDKQYERTVNYLVKYIGKGDTKIWGKWYRASRGLIRKPHSIPLAQIPYDLERDERKLATHEQYEHVICHNLAILSEELPPLEISPTDNEE